MKLGKTARQWLIQFARSYRRNYKVSGHMALEAIYDQSRAAQEGSLLKYAASAYGKCDLERLIRAVEKK